MASTRTELIDLLKNLPDDDARLAEVWAAFSGIRYPYVKNAKAPVMKPLKMDRFINGKINPMSLVEERDNYIDFNQQWFNYYGHQWPKFQEQMKSVMEQAKHFGVDLKSFAPETFSLSEIDSVDKIFEATAEQLLELEHRIKTSHEAGLKMLPDAKKKFWASVLRKAVRIQELCREETPQSILKTENPDVIETWRSLHAIRYALYVMRSNLMTSDGSFTFIDVPDHLIMACMVISIARWNVQNGVQGVLIKIAPRHGKTTLSSADRALQHIKRPDQAVAVVHNSATKAEERFNMVQDHFDDSLAIGRRRRALFPHISRKGKRSGVKMVLMVNGQQVCQQQEGNLSPAGVHSREQGRTCHEIWFDDPTDEKEQHEAGTRERTNSALSKTWLPRLTGRSAFFVYIYTAWHKDDFSGILQKLNAKGDIRLAYYALSCGGPENDFEPIWPSAGYDRRFLKQQFARLGPAEYACIYQNNPDSEAHRRIKRLHFYDRSLWTDYKKGKLEDQQWKRYFDTAKYYISVDPSGSESKYSNLAGITYWAFNVLRVNTDKGVLEVPKLLALGFWSFPGSQHTLTATLAEYFPRADGLHRVLIETTSGYHATAEDLVLNHEYPTHKVIKRTPGTGTKISRFMRYAVHIENGDVLFPGEWTRDDHGELALTLHPDWTEFGDQILQAGNVTDDNLLDCSRQMISEVSHEIFQLKGEVDPEVGARTFRPADRERRMRFWESKFKKPKEKSHRPRMVDFSARKAIWLN